MNHDRVDSPPRPAARALRLFAKTPRTEAAFYLRFQRLAEPHVTALLRWWHLPRATPLEQARSEWRAFRNVCRFWGVGAVSVRGSGPTRSPDARPPRSGAAGQRGS